MNSIQVYLQAIEAELHRCAQTQHPLYAEFFNMFHYHLGWTDVRGNPQSSDTGKRLRPLICLWSCEATGGDWRDALPAAAAIELIHNFSLIHDDIEDNSEQRRGRAAVWQVWGLAQGVNAGDGMFVLAHLALDRLSADVSLERHSEIHRTFDAATFALTQGQFLDLAYERADQVTPDQYLEMVRGKTAALMRAACEMGARIGTQDKQRIQCLAEYGENLGIAFQIADDVLGIWGDPARTGKSARADLYSRKKSFPIIVALRAEQDGELLELYRQPTWTENDVQRVESILEQTHARELAVTQAASYAHQALEALAEPLFANPASEHLRGLVENVVNREK